MACVGILMGSDSDWKIMEEAAEILKTMGVDYEIEVISAHRTPAKASDYALNAKDRGIKVIIAGAGMAAHLAGVLAAHTVLPVIGVPIASGPLHGQDALLSTVQMPPGIPVATVGINGAKNAGILACEIISLGDEELRQKLLDYRQDMARKVAEKSRQVQESHGKK